VKSKDGKQTGEFGFWLSQSLGENSQYSVYYDHADKQEDSNVAVVKGFYGQQVANKNRLTDIDVMVINNENDEVILLIEIEETEMSPKKLLGDVFATLMCNRFAVRKGSEQRYFSISPKTRLIVTGVLSSLGSGQEKIKNIIVPRLRQFDIPDDAIQADNIKFVIGEDISEMIKELKSETKSYLEID
jgi:hypothetical protein